MDCKIVKATIDDLAEVARLFDEYRQFYSQSSDIELATHFIKSRILEQSSVIFLAKDSLNVGLGFAQLYPSFSSISARPTLILNDLYVSKFARCVGVGKTLISRCNSYAIMEGIVHIGLQTHKENKQAQLLYERLGFIQDEEFLSYGYEVC
ncbi:GNAT family N-acetyltransferase [Parashewanella spongiae]|uniref:GNAT family N-acetyltransferase n=1 Tax=Parashewanella spongiae TaxID=342950 RepID=A0A3A6UJT2_9GAMM|nr:GNAT family N-acetyltransferase [Parashewanella spongiae]MCL1080169.1 GNAT family N-acetyltransferase [Parashewanella spongiae]RJY19451.1 GNAT family N-acetyltransferase [Parashewanella spongiae]